METEFVLVECISQYRMRYVVEVPKGKSDWALDTVACEQAKEFSQKWLGETIFSHQVIPTRDGVIALCDKDNDYCSTWPEDQKLEVFVTEWKEE